MTKLDEIDIDLLTHLQKDARMTNTALAQLVNLSPPGLQKRLKKLEKNGVISQYVALLDREKVGIDMLCMVQVTLQRHKPAAVQNFKEWAEGVPEVLECFHLTGEFDYLLKVVVKNRKKLEQFILESLTPVEGVDKIRTSLVLSEIKSTTAVPLHNREET